LKARLDAAGWFAPERKRPLPAYPRVVGIVTSTRAAALRDLLTTLKRCWPALAVIVYPTPVQGEGAAESIAQAIRTANMRAEADVLIVARGGGSIEDLWACNEESVAQAIFDSALPVVSGVGHETDFTICDFVADARAPTPTAAAALVAPDCTSLLRHLAAIVARWRRAQVRLLEATMQQLDGLSRRLTHPAARLDRQARDAGLLAEGSRAPIAIASMPLWRASAQWRNVSHGASLSLCRRPPCCLAPPLRSPVRRGRATSGSTSGLSASHRISRTSIPKACWSAAMRSSAPSTVRSSRTRRPSTWATT
jgi:exodeoxyribonuclease VII large subunit